MCPQGPSAHLGPRAFWLGGVWSVGQLSEDGRGIGSVGDVVAVALRVLPGRGRGAGRGRRARRVHARRVHASEDRWWAAVEWDPPSWSYLPNIIRLIQDFRDRDSDSDGLRGSLTNSVRGIDFRWFSITDWNVFLLPSLPPSPSPSATMRGPPSATKALSASLAPCSCPFPCPSPCRGPCPCPCRGCGHDPVGHGLGPCPCQRRIRARGEGRDRESGGESS